MGYLPCTYNAGLHAEMLQQVPHSRSIEAANLPLKGYYSTASSSFSPIMSALHTTKERRHRLVGAPDLRLFVVRLVPSTAVTWTICYVKNA